MIMIDTDIFIDNFRGLEKARDFFENIIKENKGFYFSAITEAELLSGKECEEKSKRNKVLQLLSQGQKLVIDNKTAKIAGEFRRRYNIGLDDAFIGATAMIYGAILLTRNSDDFKKINGLIVKRPY